MVNKYVGVVWAALQSRLCKWASNLIFLSQINLNKFLELLHCIPFSLCLMVRLYTVWSFRSFVPISIACSGHIFGSFLFDFICLPACLGKVKWREKLYWYKWLTIRLGRGGGLPDRSLLVCDIPRWLLGIGLP